jgi:UPF0716 protein FxsA
VVAIWLFLLFVAVPIIEIALFIEVGGAIGLFPTLALVVLAAVVGAAVIRRQGLQALARLRSDVEAGGDPVGPIAHGALILVAGMLLLAPGFFTDAIGLLLLVPAVRRRLIDWGAARVAARVTVATTSPARGRPPARPSVETIETDYEVIEEHRPRQGPSGWTKPHS